MGVHVLESAAIRNGQAWPERLDWARLQSPSEAPEDDAAIEAWRAVVDPGRTGRFERRLIRDGLTYDQGALALSPVGGSAQADHAWWPFVEAFRQACQASLDDDQRTGAMDWPPGAALVPFAHLLWPGVADAWQRLAAAWPDVLSGVASGAQDDLSLALLSRLGEVMGPSLLADFTSTQAIGQRMLQKITAAPINPPSTHYLGYCRGLADGGLDRVLLEHPVLPSLVGTVIRQWQAATVEMLERIHRHRPALCGQWGIGPDAELTRAAMSAGDGHNDGRSVAVLSFGSTKVVYKPRDCRLELLWAEVLSIVNAHVEQPGLRAPRVIVDVDAAGAHFGLAEFIDHVPASSQAAMGRFYVNAGRTLAVLYALSATDCHFENLIAHDDQLVLVDGEALFETRSPRMQQGDADQGVDSGPSTVLQAGLLPTWMWMEGERAAMDVSALGCQPGGDQRTTTRGWRSVNTDAMSRGLTGVTAPPPVSLPTPPGVEPDLEAHVADVTVGFASGYQAVMAARVSGLLELLDSARQLYRRLIQRPTYVYAALLSQSREPDALRSMTARGLVLEKLARAYLTDDENPTWPLLRAEQSALARMDIPLFEAALDGSHTRSRDVELLDWPGMDTMSVVLQRIVLLDESDLRWQQALIRASFAAHAFDGNASAGLEEGEWAGAAATPGELHDRCVTRITANATTVAGTPTWMTLGLLPDGQKANVQGISSGLYDGVLGVAVLLHEAGQHATATAATEPLLRQLDPDDPLGARRQLLAVGPGFTGAGGYLRALRLLERQGHLDAIAADRAVSSIIDACAHLPLHADRRLDWLGGVAGLIGPLADELADERLDDHDRERASAVVLAAAERLLSTQTLDGGWCTMPGSGALTGLAHGASGIAVALVRAAEATQEPRFIDAALRGLEFEQGHFDAKAGNWRDLRAASHGGFMLGWCAGAPGIALTRLALLELLPDHPDALAWRAQLDTAVATTAAPGLLSRDHVCCGNLGRSAVLAEIGLRLGRSDCLDAARAITGAVTARTGQGLPRSFLGTTEHTRGAGEAADDMLAVPGLMTGLSGAGLVLGGSDVWRSLLVP